MSSGTWITSLQVVGWWYLLGLLCAVWVTSDLVVTNRRLDRPLRLVWPLLVLVWSLPGLLLYLGVSRPLGYQLLDEDAAQQHRPRFAARRWRRVIGAALLATGSAGIALVGVVALLRLAGAPLWAQLGLGFAAGFVCSGILGQEALVRQSGREAEAVWIRATFAGVLVVLLASAGTALLVAPRAATAGNPLAPDFWFMVIVALAGGTLVALPVNWLLVRRRWAAGVA